MSLKTDLHEAIIPIIGSSPVHTQVQPFRASIFVPQVSVHLREVET